MFEFGTFYHVDFNS